MNTVLVHEPINNTIPYVVCFLISFLIIFYFSIFRIRLKAKRLHSDIEKERKILYEGRFVINHQQGFLFLTEKTLEFYYLNKKNENFYLSLKDVINISISGDFFFGYKIIVNTNTENLSFYHDKAKMFKKTIDKILVQKCFNNTQCF